MTKSKTWQGEKTIVAMWDEFAKVAVPADAPRVQAEAMRIAFYAGVEQMYLGLMWAVGGDDTPEEVGMAYLEKRHAEIAAFNKDLQERLDLRAHLQGRGLMSRRRES